MATVPGGTVERNQPGDGPPAQFQLKQPRLEELLAYAPAAIAFLSGPELRCSFVNEVAVRVTGRRSADQLLEHTVREALPELEGTGVFEILDEVARTCQPFCGREFKVPFLQFATGKIEDRYFDFVCQPMLDASAVLSGIFIHAVDMTDRVLSRRALETSETRLRMAHEAAQIGTWEWDPVENTRVLSVELHRMFGTEPSEVGGHEFALWAQRVYRTDWPRVKLLMAEAQQTGAVDFEYRYEHPERGLRTFHTKGARAARSTRFFGVVRDITEKKTAESQLQEQRERFEFAADAANIGYWFCDLPLDKLSWDDRVKEHFWLPPEADVDIHLFYERLHPDDREPTRRAMENAIGNHAIFDVEYRTVSPEGKQKWIRATGRTAYDAAGRPIRFDGVTQDVTALKQTREALIRSEKLALVGRLAASISHEINNPLEAVINLLYLINLNSSDTIVKTLSESAQRELARVSHIVTHTLRFNRRTQGATQEKVSELLESSAAIYQPRMKDAGIEILRDYQDRESVLCFGSELRQVFANLIANSFDASRRGGKLLLRTRDHAHPRTGEMGVRVSIADSGAGMDQATLQRLFEPFFTTKGDQGTGLGLWVSREILRKHRAVMRVRSLQISDRSGTTFSIWLPLSAPLEREG